MPNRVIKDSIKRSPQIDSLTWFEEVVFIHMIITADDYGCLDGRMVVLKNDLFPTKENVTKKAIEDAVSKLVSVGLLRQYEVNGMPYLFFPTWEKHQRIRNKFRKYPVPAFDSNPLSNVSQSSAVCSYEIQSESNPNPNPNPKPNPDARATAADDGMPFGLTEADVDASLAIDQRIEDACRTWGLHCAPGNFDAAHDMIREYGEEWLFQAIQIAGENRPTWGYVRGVLQKAKQNGSMELPKGQKPGKTVSAQQYGQREYTEEELTEVSGDLIAEARALYGD